MHKWTRAYWANSQLFYNSLFRFTMATKSLRLHVNGTNYVVTGISDGTSYKDILCTIAKSKTEDEACSGLLTLTEMRQNKINAKRIRSPRICRKASLNDDGMKETGDEKTGPRKSVEKFSRRRKESCSSKEKLKTWKKEKEASPRRKERALDDSDIETFRRSRRRLKNQIKRKAREESDVKAYQNLQNVANLPRRQISTEKKQLGDKRYRSYDDVQKISIYYIDEKIDKSLLDYDDIAKKACIGDSLLAMRNRSSSRESAASVSEVDRCDDFGHKDEAAQNTEDKDSGIPSWESEECSSKDGNKKEESSFNYENKRERNHFKDMNNSKESCFKARTMQEERLCTEGDGRGEGSTDGVDRKCEERLTEVFERSLFVELQRNLDSDIASRLGSSCPNLFETGKEGSKRIPKVSSSTMILDDNGNEYEIAEELLPVVNVENDFCERRSGKLTSENSESSEVYERVIETSSKQRISRETEHSYDSGEKTEGEEVSSDFEEIRIPPESTVNTDSRKREALVDNAKKVDTKRELQFAAKKGPKKTGGAKGNKELTCENSKKANRNTRTIEQEKPGDTIEAPSKSDNNVFKKRLSDSTISKGNVLLRDQERHVSCENRGSFILIDLDETDLHLPLVKSEGNNVSNSEKDITRNEGDREKLEEISDLQSMGQTCSAVASGVNDNRLVFRDCEKEEREQNLQFLHESNRSNRESDCGSTTSSSDPGDFEIKRKTSTVSRKSSCSSFEADNVSGIRNKRIVYVEKLSEKGGDSKQDPDAKTGGRRFQKRTNKIEKSKKATSNSKEKRKISEGNYSQNKGAAIGNIGMLSKSLEAFSSEMDRASLKIENCRIAVSNVETRKVSKKSSTKIGKETATDDGRKYEKVKEQEGVTKNALQQRQKSDFDEIEDYRNICENSLKNGNGKGLFSWFKKKNKKSPKLTDRILKENLTIQAEITNETVMKVAAILGQNNAKIIGGKSSCGKDFDENNNRKESTEIQEDFKVYSGNIDAGGVLMGSVCERETTKESKTIVEDIVKLGFGLDEREIEENDKQLKEDVTECEIIKNHVQAESVTKENEGTGRDDFRQEETTAGDARNIVAKGLSVECDFDASCKQKSSDNKTGDHEINEGEIKENSTAVNEHREQDKQVAGIVSVRAMSDIGDSKTCELNAEKSVEMENVENKISDSMAVTEVNAFDRKRLWMEYREVCDKIIEIAEKLLYLDLILNQKRHELQEIRANELLYEDGALDHDEKLIVRDIKDFRKYLKTVTLFSMRQREELQENEQELEKLDRILRKKQSVLESLENMVMFKRFHDTPRQLLRKYAKRYVFKMSLPIGIEAL